MVGKVGVGDAPQVVPEIVLASGSVVRARLLKNAGLDFTVDVAAVDEETIKESMLAENASARDIADELAELKALRVSRRHPEALVIGADQILGLGKDMFDKPVGMDGARNHLQSLRGKEHRLVTAACVVQNGKPLWRHVEIPKLTMRNFSDEFLEDYLAASGTKILSSVGGYLLEERGAQLFSKIDGDYFSILGLPLLQLLDFLREHGVGMK
ncbi:MAG: septum formation protein Maf [Alphaproteobacteria bacterium]|nr:septum formation protein Maf [Rhodospirillaceae bacterium]MBT4018369.1 septum formation protein Maf [Alphaproteobacteria bacterium]MBT5158894.1 septum formation protein Maf [Alphaproteobacteria bacterium]MBT5919433.1 septum formation protein Maf [Alphaproteobacteria bacterium]